MNSEVRDITFNVSKDNIQAQVGQFLYATSHIQDNEDILDMELGKPDLNGNIPVRVKLQRENTSFREEVLENI